jgi:hypothetical protein
MSTPSEKSLNPIDPSASESDETREWTGAMQHSVENNYGPLQSPYASKKARAQPAVEQEPAASCEELVQDLKRLAASVRGVQREEAATRLPRDAQLHPVPGVAPLDARGRGYSEMFDNDFSSLPSREPERLMPRSAMRSRPDTLHGPLIVLTVSILIVSIFAAPIAYYFSVGSWGPSSKRSPGSQMASFDSRFITPPLSSSSQEGSRTITARDDDHGSPAETDISSERSKLSLAAKSFARATEETLLPGTSDVQDLSPARAPDPEEISLLKKQGEQFIAVGDVVAARLPFQRAAEAGNADAAVALGATYDPALLAKLGVVGKGADVVKARSWYEKAEKLGSPEARWRLDLLEVAN